MKFICADANLIQGVNLDTDYDYITARAKSHVLAIETLANSFAKSKSDCVLFVWDTDDPADLVRATEEACVEDVNFKKIIDDLEKNLDYSILGDFDLESIELENGMTISVVKYVTMNNFVESKKSATKSIKESKDITIEEFISDYKNNDCFSIRDKENGHESECFWGSKKDVLDSDYRLFTVLDTDVNKETDDTILYIDLEENAWVESKKSARKSIKESADDNWYKLKMLNEMLDAMEEDEYNIPKLGIYGVTKNINLDEGAIEALIKYYK